MLQALQALGLDQTTEAVYRLLLANQDSGVADIAGQVGVPETDVHECLDRLTSLGLLRTSLDSPGSLLPVTPTVAFQVLIQRQEADLLRRQQEFLHTQTVVTQLAAQFTDMCCPGTSGTGNETERIEGLDAIQARLEQLANSATTECLSFMPGGAQSAQSLEASKPLDEAMLKRGVKVLTLYLDSVRNDGPTLNYARWLTELGGEVRTVPVLPIRTVMFDRTAAILPVDPENTRLGAVQVGGAGVMTALTALFEQTWAQATPFGGERQRSEDGCTPQEREMLRFLAQGLTDEVVGKRLGLGVRTVRRMMADISDRLEARSRFEIGVKACERGWLKP